MDFLGLLFAYALLVESVNINTSKAMRAGLVSGGGADDTCLAQE